MAHVVKFSTNFISHEIPQDARIDELKKYCRKFHELKLAPYFDGISHGNLSFRISPGENAFIITGSQIGLQKELSDDCFVKVMDCDFKKKIVHAAGTREPSSESMLHYSIYRERNDVNAIFHGHSESILMIAQRLNIQQTLKEEPYGSIELVRSVMDILKQNYFIVMKNHGFLSLGKNMNDAMDRAMTIYNRI